MRTSRFGVWAELKVLRSRSGWSGVKLAMVSGVSKSYFYQLERGHRWPNAAVTKKLAVALKVPVTMLERPLSEKDGGVA